MFGDETTADEEKMPETPGDLTRELIMTLKEASAQRIKDLDTTLRIIDYVARDTSFDMQDRCHRIRVLVARAMSTTRQLQG